MWYKIWCPNCKRAVQHPEQEDKPTASIACRIFPIWPYRVGAGIRSPTRLRHDCANDDRDEYTSNYSEATDCLNAWQCSVQVENHQSRDPRDKQIRNKDMPLLGHKVGMLNCVHGHKLRCRNLGDWSKPKEPREAVPPAGEPSTRSPIPASGDCGPVIYYGDLANIIVKCETSTCSRRWDRWCELCDRGRNKPVKKRRRNELVDDSRKAPIVYCSGLLAKLSTVSESGDIILTILPLNAIHALPVVIPNPHRLIRPKFRSSSCLWPEILMRVPFEGLSADATGLPSAADGSCFSGRSSAIKGEVMI